MSFYIRDSLVLLWLIVLFGAPSIAETPDWEPSFKRGTTLMRDGAVVEAEPHLRRAVKAAANLGELDPAFADCLIALHDDLLAQGRTDELETLVLKALVIREKAKIKDPVKIAEALIDLADLRILQNRFDEAETIAKRVSDFTARELGPDNPISVRYLDVLFWVSFSRRDYDSAIRQARRSLDRREKLKGPNYVDNRLSTIYLTMCYDGLQDYKEAEKWAKRAIKITQGNYTSNHTTMITPLTNLAKIYIYTGNLTSAKELALRSLGIASKVYGKDHSELMDIHGILAEVYAEEKDYVKSEQHIKQVISSQEVRSGPDADELLPLLDFQELLLMKMNRIDDAARIKARAERIKSRKKPTAQ